MIGLEITGDGAAVARLGGFADRLQARLAPALAQLGADLQEAVADNLSGGVLQRRSGRLAEAQTLTVTQDGDAVSVALGFDPAAVPYGAIQEYGGTTRAHLIAARQAKALAFSLGGRLVLAKQINHPGSHIPERSFLRSALAELAPDAVATLQDSVADETNA